LLLISLTLLPPPFCQNTSTPQFTFNLFGLRPHATLFKSPFFILLPRICLPNFTPPTPVINSLRNYSADNACSKSAMISFCTVVSRAHSRCMCIKQTYYILETNGDDDGSGLVLTFFSSVALDDYCLTSTNTVSFLVSFEYV